MLIAWYQAASMTSKEVKTTIKYKLCKIAAAEAKLAIQNLKDK